MQFENTFSVDAPIERVWNYLLDVEAVAPCLPGAQLTETVSETEYKGSVKVKLGAMQVNYKGTLILKEVDQAAHRVVLTASGNELRGTGGASGTVTSTLVSESPERTSVQILSEVNITGRVAQFGRNIIQDVSNKLIREFAQCLEANLTRDAAPDDRAQLMGPSSPTVAEDPPSVSILGTSPSGLDHAGKMGTRESSATVTSRLPSPEQAMTEIRVMPLVLDVMRSRVAGGLRSLAGLLDPDDKTP